MLRSSLLVSVGSIATLVFGFAAQTLIAFYFGAGGQMDAFMSAFVIPSYLQGLLFIGLPFVLVPLFTRERTLGSAGNAWGIVGTLFGLVAGVTLIISICGTLFAEKIVTVSAPGLSPDNLSLAASMLRILAFCLPAAALGTLASGVQNARGSFLWPALAQAVGILGNISVVAIGHRALGAMSLAWGALLAALIQGAVTTVPMLRAFDGRMVPLNDSRVLKLLRLMAPVVILGVPGRAIPVLERFFASHMPPGSVSYLGYAARLAAILPALIGTGISTASFPDMARAYSTTGLDGLKTQYLKAMRLTWAMSLPIVVLASVASEQIVTVLFERGRFSHQASLATASVVPWLVASTLCNVLGSICGKSLYVLEKTFVFNLFAALPVLFYPFLAMVLAPHLGFLGLAIAGLLVTATGTVSGFGLVWSDIHVVGLKYLPRYLLGSLFAGLAGWYSMRAVPTASALIALIIAGTTGAATYFTYLLALDPEFAKALRRSGRWLGRAKGASS